MNRLHSILLALSLALVAPASVRADEADGSGDSHQAAQEDAPTALVSARIGVFVPQLFNRLTTSYLLSIGGGYVLPVLDHRLAVVLDIGYTQPEHEQMITDPRLTMGSTYHYDLIQHDLMFFLGAQYHFADLRRGTLIPYAGLGLRVHLLKSEIDGAAQTSGFGTNNETSTKVGGALRGGLGYMLGPGFAALEIEFALAPIDHDVTGDANVGDFAASIGYTLVL